MTESDQLPDLEMAQNFLRQLDPAGIFTFQTFDDKNKGRSLARVFHGPFDQHQDELSRLNALGAGVFVMINKGDGVIHPGNKTFRTAKNVVAVRAWWVDLDGAPLEPVREALQPDSTVESSPGRWHAYWLNHSCPLQEFKAWQSELAAKFDSDPTVTDLPRVMRLPGFYHHKGVPFKTMLLDQKQATMPNDITRPHVLTAPRHYLVLANELGLSSTQKAPRGKAPPSKKKSALHPPASDDGIIREPGRNNALTSKAGLMRRHGKEQAAIKAELLQINQACCEPPLPPDEVSNIAKSVAGYTPSDPDNILETLTDVGNADRFVARWKDQVKYVPEWHKWLTWDGGCWIKDECEKVMEMAKQVARDIYLEGNNIKDTETRKKITAHSGRSQQEQRLHAMTNLAKSVPALIARAGDLDQKPDLLCVANGVVDLNTGKLRGAKPEDLITQRTPVSFDPKAKCPEFLQFLQTIMDGKQDLIDYIERVIGYILTGHTGEQCLFFLFGYGANGKSTLLNVVTALLGPDYAKQTPSETLMVKYGGRGASNDLARLAGARAVIANEIEGGAHLAESEIKQLTGGDTITARFLYGEYSEFRPAFKLVMAGNHKPVIRNDDHGMWRRIHLVPFEVAIPEDKRDPHLAGKLRAEMPGILNWAIGGCLKWKKDGLKVPSVIKEAVSEYREEMDIIGQWLTDSAEVAAGAEWRASEVYSDYKSWALMNTFKPMTSSAFGRKLTERFDKKKNNKGVVYVGLKRKPFTNGGV
jgi:putative DNA primase/helicase